MHGTSLRETPSDDRVEARELDVYRFRGFRLKSNGDSFKKSQALDVVAVVVITVVAVIIVFFVIVVKRDVCGSWSRGSRGLGCRIRTSPRCLSQWPVYIDMSA